MGLGCVEIPGKGLSSRGAGKPSFRVNESEDLDE